MSDWRPNNWRKLRQYDLFDEAVNELESRGTLMTLGAKDRAEIEEIIADLNKPDFEFMDSAYADLIMLVQDIRHRTREAEVRERRSVGGQKSGKTRQAETVERDARIRQQHESGVKAPILARRFSLSASQIRRILKRRA